MVGHNTLKLKGFCMSPYSARLFIRFRKKCSEKWIPDSLYGDWGLGKNRIKNRGLEFRDKRALTSSSF